jgi:hypothetical protein
MIREWKGINRKKITIAGFFGTLIVFSFLVNTTEGQSKVYYGKVVRTEFTVIQVKGDDGKSFSVLVRPQNSSGFKGPIFRRQGEN